MYVCCCMAVTDEEVTSAIAAGAHTREAVTRACAAGADCGACHGMIETMIEDHLEEHGGRPRSPSTKDEGALVSPEALTRGRAA